ncbi:serine hydroxymethyltransferase [Candidatus Woesearchaeota archaeon]|nr:serine hydroxymethyltransferase [Candidatus Woesearchaeota archaeon]
MKGEYKKLREKDKKASDILVNELKRQQSTLGLIASENFVSTNVLRATGSVFTNKYSEGYPAKRYYGGNKYVDEIEILAQERAKELFGAEHVNVQPYSGSPANLEVYFAVLNHGDKVLGMNLAHGGHLTHGHPINFSGKTYKFIQYGVDKKTHLIDYDEIRKLAKKEKPKLILSGATAYPREIDFKIFHEIAEEIGAISMVDMSHIAGLIAAKVHPSPFPFTDIITTTTHKTLRGPRGAMILCKEKFAKDIDRAVFPGMQGGPHNHTTAGMTVAFGEALKPEFKEYAKQIVKNCKTLAEELTNRGMNLVSGGTDNHLILADLTSLNISGKEAESLLEEVGIIVNKNMVPYDKRSPFDPSGIRIGTAGLTTRGMKESEMKLLAELMMKTLKNKDSKDYKLKVKQEVKQLCEDFPIYNDL